MEKIELSNPLKNILSLLQRITPLVSWSADGQHASAQDSVIVIPHETIVRYLDESQDSYEFYHKMRITLIQTLIDRQYPSFVMQPYQEN